MHTRRRLPPGLAIVLALPGSWCAGAPVRASYDEASDIYQALLRGKPSDGLDEEEAK